MRHTLLPHQIADATFLAERRVAGCFNGMGTGKTLTALEACLRADCCAAVIVCPPIALHMWKAEAEAHLECEKAQILSTGRTKIDPDADVLIVSYALATTRALELAQWAERQVRPALICDESHALKTLTSKRTKAILGGLSRDGLINHFHRAWFLTGSPIVRWADDILPFLARAAPTELEVAIGRITQDRFNLRFCITQRRQFPGQHRPKQVVVGSRNMEELGEILARCATRRTLDEVWEQMPPITYTELPVEVSGVKSLLKDVEKMSMAEIEQAIDEGDEALATIRRELGLALVPAAVEHLADMVEAKSGSVLVGAWHRDVIHALVEQLSQKGLRVAKLDGSTPPAQKARLQESFNEGALDILVGQIAAMGVSLNLQRGGNRIVVVEQDWSPAVMDQFYARLHRMGQAKAVHVDTLFIDCKLNRAVQGIAKKKRAAADATGRAHQEAAQ